MKKDINTEEKILLAAEDIFQVKGFEGARMQEIADHASINKGLLHYYFRTKNILFETIFSKAMGKIMIRIEDIMKEEIPFFDKTDAFIDSYMDILLKNPYLPKFVISELNRDPDRFISALLSRHNFKTRVSYYLISVEKAINAREIKPVDPRQLLIDMISLCVFPFIGRPLIQAVLGIDNAAFKTLLNERKSHVKLFIKNSLV